MLENFSKHSSTITLGIEEANLRKPGNSVQAYLYTSSSDNWSEITPLSQGRYGHSCGLVEDPEKKVVVVGGTTVDGSETKEVEIYRVVHVNGGDSLPCRRGNA